MIEISITAVLILLSIGAFLAVLALWALEELISDYTNEINEWKHVAEEFSEACEIDGFGGVRSADYGDLTRAMQMYKAAKNA